MANEKQITLTYLNVRESIAILLSKLVVTDIVLAGIIIGIYFALVRGTQFLGLDLVNPTLFLSLFISLGIVKILITCFVVLDWLYEYYEITPEYVVHKHGIIFKKQEHFKMENIRAINVQDSFLGQIFNFATITIYDVRLNKYLDMYLIHNAKRYAKVFKQLRPNLELKEDRVWLPNTREEEIAPIEEE